MNLFSPCQRARRAAAAYLLSLIAACAPKPKPSDREIATQVMQKVAGTNDFLMVRNVKKTKGTRKDDGGYVVDVKYDLVFKTSSRDAVRHMEAASDTMNALQTMQPLLKKYGWWGMCDIAHEQGRFPFIQSATGWVIPGEFSRDEQDRGASHEKDR